MLKPSKNTALILMLKLLHSLAVLKLFYWKTALLLHKMTINAIRDETRVLPLGDV